MNALVIDDSRAIRRLLGRMLKTFDFEISEGEDGQHACEVLEKMETPPDLICIDWNMPNMNGYDFIKHVRSFSKYDNVQLMMVTTESEIGRMVDALEAGANEYVMKPFTADVIEEKLSILGLI